MVAIKPKIRFKILIIDDDKDICDFMETFLKGEGYQVRTLQDTRGLIDIVRKGGFHMIVVDLMMPGVYGLDLIKDIQKVDSEASIVVFTGYPSLETALESLKLEVFDYIKKPFSPTEFKEVIRRIVKKKGLLTDPEEMLHRAIGAKIRIQRKKKKLTLKHISNRTGLSVSLLSQIERAESSASLSSLYKIANALDTKLQYLFRDF